MQRAKSVSYSSRPTNPVQGNATPLPSTSTAGTSPPTRQRTITKSSSFADLRLTKNKFLRRFKSKDFDFGCAGDAGAEIEEEEEAGDRAGGREAAAAKMPLRGPQPFPRSGSAAATTVPPARPPPADVLDESKFSPDEIRALQRQKEEALAAEACLDYISSHRHSRKSSRSSSLAKIDTAGLGLERLSLHDREATFTPADTRPRSDSTASSLCSSRPRTNDSLPSFASSDAPTISSSGSYPSSPVQSPSLRSRPTFSGPLNAFKPDADASTQPRAYAFI
ncbi:hypothetical protein JCM1841_005298 [Sporobolomyces salmonicolor]